MSKRRKICFVITSHIHYGRSRVILRRLKARKDVELQIVVGASAILPQYGNVLADMKRDGFTHHAKITMTLAGGDPVAMAKTTGIGITEFATAFENLQPDVVVVRGDRYEVLAAAAAAAYMNIPVAHIEGGDSTGSIDESVRHAVTKLAHIHFPTNELAEKRLLRMGEDPRYVFNVGCSELEPLASHDKTITSAMINRHGVGDPIDIRKPFILVIYHPVTTQVDVNRKHAEALLRAIGKMKMQTIWFWPNVDAGTDQISKAIRVFREHDDAKHIRFAKYVDWNEFIALLKQCACLVGNSSAGIKEASFLGTPVVNVGSRQHGRLRGENVMDTAEQTDAVVRAVRKQITHGRFAPSSLYYKKHCGKTIADTLATVDLYVQKTFFMNHDG